MGTWVPAEDAVRANIPPFGRRMDVRLLLIFHCFPDVLAPLASPNSFPMFPGSPKGVYCDSI